MDNGTPANTIKSKDLDANTKALRSLLGLVTSSPTSVLDVRYGLGGWARAVLERFPRTRITGYEYDQDTYKSAWRSNRVKLYQSKYESDYKSRSKYDLVLADFNRCTRLNKGELVRLMKSVDPNYLAFTDVACGKMHLNYRSYGLTKVDLEEYFLGYLSLLKGYELLGYRREHHFAATALFRRK